MGAARAGLRDRRSGCAAALPRRRGADRLLRRALDGGELHDRRPRHARPGAGAAVRLSQSRAVRGADRPAGRASAAYLERQSRAGAEAVQIFDSWAGVLPPAEFERWCVAPIARIVAKLSAAVPGAPIIAFPRGAATQLGEFAAIDGLAAIGLDTAVDPRAAAARCCPRASLCKAISIRWRCIAGGRALDEGIERALQGFAGRAHVFNLGHGILPETPIAHVERLVARVRAAG